MLSSNRNDLALTTEKALIEAHHLCCLYDTYAYYHNDHWTPYNASHPDVLERRIYELPDIDLQVWQGDNLWYVGAETGAALRTAMRTVRIRLGKINNPPDWSIARPWANCNIYCRFDETGFPYIAEPHGISDDYAFSHPFDTFDGLQRFVAKAQFWAIITNCLCQVFEGFVERNSTNVVWAGYARHSPAIVSAHRKWLREWQYPVDGPSEDWLSDDGEVFDSHLPTPPHTHCSDGYNSDDQEMIADSDPSSPAYSPVQLPSPPRESTPPFDAAHWRSSNPDVVIDYATWAPVVPTTWGTPGETPQEWLDRWNAPLPAPQQWPISGNTTPEYSGGPATPPVNDYDTWQQAVIIPSSGNRIYTESEDSDYEHIHPLINHPLIERPEYVDDVVHQAAVILRAMELTA